MRVKQFAAAHYSTKSTTRRRRLSNKMRSKLSVEHLNELGKDLNLFGLSIVKYLSSILEKTYMEIF
jgi:hypothetical protein